MTQAKKPAAKKPVAKPVAKKPVAKPVAKKPVAKPVAPKVIAPVAKIDAPKVIAPKKDKGEGKLLYTIRLEPEFIAKLEAEGAKRGVKHAVVAREAIHAYFAQNKKAA